VSPKLRRQSSDRSVAEAQAEQRPRQEQLQAERRRRRPRGLLRRQPGRQAVDFTEPDRRRQETGRGELRRRQERLADRRQRVASCRPQDAQTYVRPGPTAATGIDLLVDRLIDPHYLHTGGYVFTGVSLFVCWKDYEKAIEENIAKNSVERSCPSEASPPRPHEPRKNPLDFAGNPHHVTLGLGFG